MAYIPKTDWKLEDTVTERDFNRIEGGIKEALAAVNLVDQKDAETLNEAKQYTDQKVDNIEVPVKSVNDKTGDVVLAASDIQTGSGKDVETTINELFTSVSDGKEQVAKAITDQGVSATKEDAFKDLATKIRSIDNGNIPIYVQPTEPIKKTGFWIQDEQNEIEHVVYTNAFSEGTGWAAGADMPTARDDLTSSAVGDKIYVIGGFGGRDKLEIYDTTTNTWTSGKDMPTARGFLTSSAVGDKIYVIGGYDGSNSLSKLEIYDTTTNTWTAGADMPTARSYLTSSAVGDKIYVIGGSGGDLISKLEIYDTATNTWKVGTSMPTARSSLTSSAVGDKIYVIDGYDGSYLNKLEIYSITSDRFPSNSLVFENGTAKDVSIPNKTKLGIKYSQRIQFNSAYYYNKLAELVYKPMYFGNGQKWTKILN
ncbi:kelch repeat-containing protein [Paenibacillus larvae]